MSKETDKKNHNFIQLYRDNMDKLAGLASENPTALKLLMFFMKHMDGTNALVVSNTALQEVLQLSKPTICRATKYLRENGWICVLKTGTSNAYIVNPDVAWTSYDYQKQYCKFNATVFLSGTENAEYLQNKKAFTKFKTIDEGFMTAVRENRETREDEIEMFRANEG